MGAFSAEFVYRSNGAENTGDTACRISSIVGQRFSFPKQFQRSRSGLQAGSRSLGCFGREIPN